MNDSDGDRVDGKRTIVGGRPHGRKPKRIPRGIETLIKRAAIDPAFRQRLFEHKDQAAREIGLKLSMAESIMLGTVRDAQLNAMIDRMQVSDEERRALLERSMLPDTNTASAPPPATLGMQPDLEGGPSSPVTRGIRPDLPEEGPRPPQSKGIRPDQD